MTKSYPVVFFVFKRPKYTYDFLIRMYDAGIKKVYVFADGPRNEEEKILTDAVRAEIERFKTDHKDIALITHFANQNTGLRKNIINGLNLVFKNEAAAIIIEDDCEPSPDFFKFTKAMLTKYGGEPRVMSINGMSVGGDYGDYSYGFTKYPQCWGWATWAKAWKLYDPQMVGFNPQSWDTLSDSLGFSVILKKYFLVMFNLIQKGQINTWDFQWTYAHFVSHGLAISPCVNLVKNIGFDKAATNTKVKSSVSSLATVELSFPLKHPTNIIENKSIGMAIERSFYKNPIAVLGLIRQYFYYLWSRHAPRS